jgi:hypothetical protein
MDTNALPKYDMSDNPTNCCPRFKPDSWNGQELSFNKKLFVKVKTRSIFHIPLNIGSVYPKTFADIQAGGAFSDDNFAILSYDPSAWTGEHYFAVTKEVPGHEMVEISGEFVTKVFEGPYKDTPKWLKEMEAYVKSKGREAKKTYFFYTTCPKCAKTYGKNYAVAFSETR